MRTVARLFLLAFFGVACAATLPGSSRASADCPVDTLWGQSKYQVFGAVFTHAARFDTTFAGSGCGPASAAYDLPAGAFASEIDFNCSGWTTTTAWDEYMIMGLPAGTPVSFQAELDANAEMISVPGSYPDISGEARLSSTGAVVAMVAVTSPRHETLVLPLAQMAGTPFALRIALRTGTNVSGGHVRVDAALRFAGLPQGAGVVSCQGYAQAPVPARPASWGSVKAAYR